MIPVAFEYERPDTLDDALALLAEHGEDAKVLAGGHSLLPVMKLRLAALEMVIDIGRLAELRYVRVEGDELAIGAGSRHHDVATSDVVVAEAPLLAASRARSATRRCATAARSAARSPTPTRPPTCPRPCSRPTERSCCAGRGGSGGCRSPSSSPPCSPRPQSRMS